MDNSFEANQPQYPNMDLTFMFKLNQSTVANVIVNFILATLKVVSYIILS